MQLGGEAPSNADPQFNRFGRPALEKRPDGTETSIALSRAKDASGAWRVTRRTTTSGGLGQIIHADGTVTATQWARVAPNPDGGFISAFPVAP
jgi:hypothetical protein